ncbi:hypothetical protein [Devriesea agamarum]|uniref:hypothetical protein n=1 Tax=Devriesea agamarum TaxID=472569 RepID=UPI0012ED266D|nr:hypothetical protein [Devriesea agamarum]
MTPTTPDGIKPGMRITMTWDQRVYQVNASPLVSHEGKPLRCHYVSEPSGKGDLMSATVEVSEAIEPGQSATVTLGAGRDLAYPHDVISHPQPLNVVIDTHANQTQHESKAEQVDSRTDQRWGMETGVVWTPFKPAAERHIWVPAAVTVFSVGPAPVPRGVRVRVEVDSRAIAGMSLGGVDARRIPGTHVLQAIQTLRQPLAANSHHTFPVEIMPLKKWNDVADLSPSTVSCEPRTVDARQRLTGRESSNRDDNAADSLTAQAFLGLTI